MWENSAEKLIRKLGRKGVQFNEDQQFQIKLGFARDLSKNQVLIYADPKYSAEQMEVIRHGLVTGLSSDQVRIFADPKFSANQMDALLYCLLGDPDGIPLSVEQVDRKSTRLNSSHLV